MPVDEVGTGVGYLCFSATCLGEDRLRLGRVGDSHATLFNGRGSGGDDEYGSNAGSREGVGAGRLTPAVGDTSIFVLGEEIAIVAALASGRDARKTVLFCVNKYRLNTHNKMPALNNHKP